MRKQFTTTIDEDITKEFKDNCSRNGVKMNDVLEAFMTEYNKGGYRLIEKRTFELSKSNDVNE